MGFDRGDCRANHSFIIAAELGATALVAAGTAPSYQPHMPLSVAAIRGAWANAGASLHDPLATGPPAT